MKKWKDIPNGTNVILLQDAYIPNKNLELTGRSILFESDIKLMFNLYIPAYSTLIKQEDNLETIDGSSINVSGEDLILENLFSVTILPT